jgi:excisionase family DNA binding protein
MSDPDIMTLEEVARYLKVKPQTVYKWAQDGHIPGTKLSKEWRFRKSILDEWIDTSILQSKGGFDLLVRSSQKAILQRGFTAEELESILRESRD